MANKSVSDNPDPFLATRGSLFDFSQMAAVDWDDIHDGVQLTPRAYTSWNALNIVRLGLAIWIICSHIAIIVFVLGKQILRTQPKNLLIVNVAVVNMLLGIFVLPAKLHFILNPDDVSCNLAIAWDFIANYFQPSVALFAVLSLVFERFVYVYTEKRQRKIKPVAQILGTIVLLIVPWVFSCLFLLPVFFGGLLARANDPSSCLYKTDDHFFLATQLLSFIPPSLGVFILAPFTGLLDCLRPKSCFYQPLTPKGESMTVTTVVTLFSIFAEAPFCTVRILMMRLECNNPYCTRFSEALTVTWWVRIIKAAVFPFVWLFYTDIRDAMGCHMDFSMSDGDMDSDEEDEFELKQTEPKELEEPKKPEEPKEPEEQKEPEEPKEHKVYENMPAQPRTPKVHFAPDTS
ncbi:cell surface protein [Elysia marginata]|uniref:Cell surface protein n=1 Tax=Elysia marginata TaxID=1093978 RepID=A0AAV4IJR6_9GAST|nr:cell surface protein [Elysia marginata]